METTRKTSQKYKFKKEDIGSNVLITEDKESLKLIGHGYDGEEIIGNKGILVKEYPEGFCDVKITKIEHYIKNSEPYEITLKFLNEQLTIEK